MEITITETNDELMVCDSCFGFDMCKNCSHGKIHEYDPLTCDDICESVVLHDNGHAVRCIPTSKDSKLQFQLF